MNPNQFPNLPFGNNPFGNVFVGAINIFGAGVQPPVTPDLSGMSAFGMATPPPGVAFHRQNPMSLASQPAQNDRQILYQSAPLSSGSTLVRDGSGTVWAPVVGRSMPLSGAALAPAIERPITPAVTGVVTSTSVGSANASDLPGPSWISKTSASTKKSARKRRGRKKSGKVNGVGKARANPSAKKVPSPGGSRRQSPRPPSPVAPAAEVPQPAVTPVTVPPHQPSPPPRPPSVPFGNLQVNDPLVFTTLVGDSNMIRFYRYLMKHDSDRCLVVKSGVGGISPAELRDEMNRDFVTRRKYRQKFPSLLFLGYNQFLPEDRETALDAFEQIADKLLEIADVEDPRSKLVVVPLFRSIKKRKHQKKLCMAEFCHQFNADFEQRMQKHGQNVYMVPMPTPVERSQESDRVHWNQDMIRAVHAEVFGRGL